MAYRLRYQCFVDWVPAGLGLGIEASGAVGPVPAGNAQTLSFFNSTSGLTTAGATLPPNSNTFLASDVTNLLTAMTADLSTQLNAQLARVQAFSSGGG
jgi:hypothetical protein